jgi:anti-sigma B factor antagonist
LSSSGWGVFASRIKDIRAGGGDIKIFGMDEEVNGIFHMLGFDSIMRSFGVLAEAIENFKSPSPAGAAPEEPLEEEGVETTPAPGGGTAGAPSDAARGVAPGLAIAVSEATQGTRKIVVLAIGGAIDSSTSDELARRLEQCAAERPAHLVLDLSDVVYVSSSGWGSIVTSLQRLGEWGGTVAIAGMNSGIQKIFVDLGFEPLIPHFGTLERALAGFGPAVKLESGVSAPRAVPSAGPAAPAKEAGDAGAAERPPRDSGAPPEESTDREDLASALLGKADIIPLEPLKPVKEDEKVIFIDFKQRTDVREEKDARIKKIGWDEYGKKLSKSDKGSRRRKK